MASQHLTKSRYMAGLQCSRRLWLVVHEPAPYEDPDAGSLMDIGQEIGTKAHLLFPGGVLITEEPWKAPIPAIRGSAVEPPESILSRSGIIPRRARCRSG